jgi:predicted RNase H-like nuclease (RuvC/YqgF family)
VKKNETNIVSIGESLETYSRLFPSSLFLWGVRAFDFIPFVRSIAMTNPAIEAISKAVSEAIHKVCFIYPTVGAAMFDEPRERLALMLTKLVQQAVEKVEQERDFLGGKAVEMRFKVSALTAELAAKDKEIERLKGRLQFADRERESFHQLNTNIASELQEIRPQLTSLRTACEAAKRELREPVRQWDERTEHERKRDFGRTDEPYMISVAREVVDQLTAALAREEKDK